MGAPVLQFKRGQFSNLPGLRAGEPGFTTDKFDLYVGIDSTTSNNKFFGSHRYWNKETTTVGSSVRLVEGSNNGANYIALKSPNSLAANVTYTLPATDVANGILVSDGSGNLSYTTTVTGSGSGLSAGTTPLTTLDIDGGTDIGADIADADLFIVDDGAGGTNRKTAASRIKNYVLGGGAGATFGAIKVSGIGTVAFVDATQLKVSGVSTFTGTVDINGAIDADGGANIAGGETVLSSATVSDLTDNRVVIAGTSGALEDSGNLTFDGSTLGVTGTVNATSFTGSGAGLSGGTTPISTLNIDGGTDIGADLADADLIVVDDGAGGTNRKSAMSRVKSYVLGGGSGATFAAINVTGISTNAFVDATQLKVSGISTFTGQTNHSTINASSTVTGTAFHTGAEGSAIRVTSNTISGPATITLDPAGVGDNTGKVTIAGDLQVDGTTTTVNSTTMTVDDKNLELGTGAANDAAANGGGITIVSGEGNKTFNFEATGDNLGSSENLNIASGKVYKVNNVETLSATTLGANVVNSSLTNVGTLTGLSVNGTASVTGQITAGDLRNSDDGLIPLVGVQTASGHSGLVTAFKFRGSGLDNFIVSDGVADVILTGVAATTYTSRQTHTATQGQTTFTVSAGYSEGFIDVYQNGVRIINGTDYAAENGSTFVLTDAATVGDEFESVAWKTLGNVATLQNLNVVDNLTVTGVTTSGTFVGDITGDITGSLANATVNTLPITVIDIDGATDIGGAIADADLFIVDDGAGGTNRKTAASRVKDYVLGGGQGANFSAISVSGIATATFLKATTATVGAGLTVTGALDVDGGANIASGLTVTGNATINSLKVSDLTNDRVLIAGTSGEIEDSGNLTFNGSTLGVTGGVTASGAIDANGGIAATTAIVEDLTDGRVVLAGSGGELEDHSNLTFDGGTLTVTGASVITSNVTIGGDLTVNGTTSQINTVNMTIEDTLMELQKVDGNNLSSDTNKDVGMVMNYYSGSAKKAAFYWDDSAARFVLAGEASETSGVMTPSAYGGLEVGSLYVNDCAGQSQVISCSGTTRSLENITLDGGSF